MAADPGRSSAPGQDIEALALDVLGCVHVGVGFMAALELEARYCVVVGCIPDVFVS